LNLLLVSSPEGPHIFIKIKKHISANKLNPKEVGFGFFLSLIRSLLFCLVRSKSFCGFSSQMALSVAGFGSCKNLN
jgi:hypothetical protein